MPPLDASTPTPSPTPERGDGRQRSNRWDWAPPDLCTPPDIGALVEPANTPAGGSGSNRRGRVHWSVDPLPAWPFLNAETGALGGIPRRGMAGHRTGAPAAPPHAPRPLGRGPRQGAPGGMHPQAAMPGWGATLATIPAEPTPSKDFGPSRLVYRLNRLWLTSGVRPFVRWGLPALLVAIFCMAWLSDDMRRQALADQLTALRVAVENQPMFMVNEVQVTSRSPEVAEGVRALLPVTVPVSSWALDLHQIRATAEALDAVASASVRVQDGVLDLRLVEREPAMVWRHAGGLDLVDESGFRVARLTARSARADLPLIAGAGAPDAIAEARQLLAAAQPWADRLRGLVRVGERRWDLVLSSGQTIQLPAEGALEALERVIALDSVQSLLARDVLIVDMRLPARPTLRLTTESAAALAAERRLEIGDERP